MQDAGNAAISGNINIGRSRGRSQNPLAPAQRSKLDEAELARLEKLEAEGITKANQKDIEELERLRAKKAAQLAAEDEFNQLIIEKDKAF